MADLTKDGRTARCQLQNHPTRKAEIRCFADGELCESRAENDPLVLFELSDAWKAGFEAKGWSALTEQLVSERLHVDGLVIQLVQMETRVRM